MNGCLALSEAPICVRGGSNVTNQANDGPEIKAGGKGAPKEVNEEYAMFFWIAPESDRIHSPVKS